MAGRRPPSEKMPWMMHTTLENLREWHRWASAGAQELETSLRDLAAKPYYKEEGNVKKAEIATHFADRVKEIQDALQNLEKQWTRDFGRSLRRRR